ncbi:msbA, partial [Symbiodinium sp. KB8]
MTMHGKVECRPAGRARTLAAGHVLLAAAGLLLWKLSAGGSDSTFVEGISKVVSGETRQVQVHMQSLKIPVEKKYRFEGTTRAKYLKRLRHRRWCAQFTYPRTFGYVLKWNDTAGEGVVIDQEQTQKYLVIRDEIGSSYHAHKTLQPAEFVEFFATDEMDEVTVHRINKDWQDSQLYNGNTCAAVQFAGPGPAGRQLQLQTNNGDYQQYASARSSRPTFAAKDGDVVQFLSKTFYVKETEEFSIIRVIRIGDLRGSCSVTWQTQDGSAVAGHKYVEGGGRITFGPGESIRTFQVEILNDDAFDTTLEFDVQLDEPENCLIDPRCAKCVVMIVDDDLFPSNDHQEVIEDHDEEALYEVGFSLLKSFMGFCFHHVPEIWWKTILVLLLANLGNLYYLATIFLRVYLVDTVLNTEDPSTSERLWVPGDRDATAVALGLAWILPNFLLLGTDYFEMAVLEMGFNIRYHLRVNLFRKYLRYTPESRAKVPIQDLKISIMEDIPDLVSDGYLIIFELWAMLGKIVMVGIFMLRKHPRSAVPLFVYPILISVYLAVTYRRRLALMAKEGEGQSATIGTLMHVNNAQKLIGCYNKRSYVVRRFEESLRNQRKWVMDLKFFDFWNAQLIPWITLLAIGTYIGLSSRLVLSGTTSLGSFLATINVYKDLGDRFSTILEGLECLSKAISPLAALTTQFNLPIDIPERSEAHKMREEFVLGLSTAPMFDSIPIVFKDISIELWHDFCKLLGCRVGVRVDGLRKALFDVTSALFPCPAVDVRDDQVGDLVTTSGGRVLCLGLPILLHEVRVFIRKKTVVQDQPDSPFSACFGEDPEEEEEEEEEEALPPWAQQLSSSEKWRFQLARAFVHDPHVLLVHRPADELDPQMQEKVLSCFRDFVDRRGLEINEEIGSHLPPDRRRPRTVVFTTGSMTKISIADYVWRIGKDGVQVENQRSNVPSAPRAALPAGTMGTMPALGSGTPTQR